ncbi:uncharacterized protein P884DRAFT_198758 [Thermothelomyces heterothallicus CBS 202.75]|uniref:uncharacterized protein n=1 Tax=Thermothelomyces heterothallicus CBS 202.75 TaxID=1149848 RepID=UPI00374494E1
MDNDRADSNLLLLSLNLSDSDPEETAPPGDATTSTTNAAGPTAEYQPTRAERTALSEEAFQALKQSYRPKVENGNIHSLISFLPSASTTSTTDNSQDNDNDNDSDDDNDDDDEDDEPLPKPAAQELLHAAEELYFFRRYAEAASFLRRVLESTTGNSTSGDGSSDGAEDGTRRRGRRMRRRRRIDDETRRLLGYYLGRCEAKLGGA